MFKSFVFSTFAISFSLSHAAIAQQPVLPWMENIGGNATMLAGIHTVSGDAAVTVSDGQTYSIKTVFHDRQRAVFRRVYADRTVTHGVEGRYIWMYDGHVETEAPAFVEEYVLGHQFHAQILFFDRLYRAGTPVASQFGGQACQVLSGEEGEGSSWRFYYNSAGRPLGTEKVSTQHPTITFKFDDWRKVSGILLPFKVWIDDGKRQFEYRYSDVLFNEGALSDLRAPENVLTDEQRLLRLHRIAMDDHWFGHTTGLKATRGDSMVIVSDGDIYRMTGTESDAMLDRIMSSRDYTVYDDLTRPAVTISEDGTLGWVIARVSAKGIRLDSNGTPTSPLEFVCAWIELYKKVQGQWRMMGNVSNFAAGRK